MAVERSFSESAVKVVFVTTGLGVGGAETMLLKLLAGMDRQVFIPSVVSLSDEGELADAIRALGIPVSALGMSRGVPSVAKFIALARHLRSIRPDLVQTWMYHADLVGGVAARVAGCRRVIWGIRHSDLSKSRNRSTTLLVVRTCAALSRLVPYKIVSCSNRAYDVHTEVGYPRSKFIVIPNGFDLADFSPDPTARGALLAELRLPREARLVGMVARFDPLKNHEGFLSAASKVSDVLPDARFVMVGKGVEEGNCTLKESINALGLGGKVSLLGPRRDVNRIMPALDVLVSTSHGEGFPNVLGEALASGVPCVATDAGDSREIVGDAGRVVAVGDMAAVAAGIIELLTLNEDGVQSIREVARRRVIERFDINRIVDQYQALYLASMTASADEGHR
jgi:glycosyltransferase involved in cell wall biosynthesis